MLARGVGVGALLCGLAACGGGSKSGAGSGGATATTGGQAGAAGTAGGKAGVGGAGGTGEAGAGRAGTGGGAGQGGVQAGAGKGGGSGVAGSAGGAGGAASGGMGGESGGGEAGSAGAAGGVAGGGGAGPSKDPVVYVGGFDYSAASSYPFTIFDFSRATGKLTARTTLNLGPNPSYIALVSPHVLAVTNETDDAQGGITHALIQSAGSLYFVDHQTGSDGGFTHVAATPDGQWLIGASYNGGSASVFGIGGDALGPEHDVLDFGSGAQTHCAAFDRSGTHAYIVNKGNDEIAQLLFGSDHRLAPNTPASVKAPAGSGPRHIALHPNGKLAFVITENASTMLPFTIADGGALTLGQGVSTLPAGYAGSNTGAHVEVSPDGRYVFGSNRGHDSIVTFSANPTTGVLTLVGHTPSGGKAPRDFDVDAYGELLIAANQDSSTLAAFRIETDGTLTPLGDPVAGPKGCAAVQIYYPP
jgi:6-phosphogluconolactonase